nr:hypothetical protein [Candidatus Accumulibacter contiguus]
MQVVRGVAAPTPRVLEFIEGVLGIRPIPVELAEGENPVAGVGDENSVFVAGDLLAPFSVGLDERKHQLAAIVLCHLLASEKCAQAARKSPPDGGLFVFRLSFSSGRGSRPARAPG